jgi:DNA-binding winged helix-turn-helix (wHTH) protein/Flp pilus assembly protein TadD
MLDSLHLGLKNYEIDGLGAMEQVSFGPFLVDMAGRRLRRGNSELELRPQAFRALNVLIRNSGRYVHHDQMIREAWDGISVSPNTVAVTMVEVKKVLQEYGSWIRCRPKLGYALEIPGAEDLIKKGWHLWERRTREGFEKALACFEQAASEDGTDFRAFEGISLSYLLLCTYGMRPPLEMYPKFLEAHQRAVELGGLTASLRSNGAHALHICERNLAEAERELKLALRGEPQRGTIYVRLAVLYSTMGRLDAALETLVQGRASDPLCPVLLSAETFIRLCRREFDEAVRCGKSSIDLHPYQHVGRAHYAEALERTGRIDEALAEMHLACVMSPDLPWLRALEATCQAKHGQRDQALATLDELKRLRDREYVDAYFVALLLDALGRRDEAFAELERARLENSATLFLVNVDVRGEELRRDPRFKPYLRRVFRARQPLNGRAAVALTGYQRV